MRSVQLIIGAVVATVASNSIVTAFVQPNGLVLPNRKGLAFVHPKVTSTVLFEIDINAVTDAVKYPGEEQAAAPSPTPVEAVAPAPAPVVEEAAAPSPAPAVTSSKSTVALPPPPAPEKSLFESIPFPVFGGPILVAGLYVSYQQRISRQARQAEEDAAAAAAAATPPPVEPAVVATTVVETPPPPEPEVEATPEAAEAPVEEAAPQAAEAVTDSSSGDANASSGADSSE